MNFSQREAGTPDRPASEPARYVSVGVFALLELFENDHGEVANLLQAAIASIERDVIVIAGSAAGDRYTIVEAAHRIKGTSGSIGARRLVEISSRIEGTANRSEPFEFAGLNDLRLAVAQIGIEIAEFVETLHA